MDKQKNALQILLMTAGIIEILIAVTHFMMPYFTHQESAFTALRSEEVDFIDLLILAIGILLLAFGSITIFFSKHVEGFIDAIYYYLIIKVILWALRVVLEMIYPVQLNLFFIEPFTIIVLPGLIFECLLFCVAFILTMQLRNISVWEKSV